ncbi:hypothetical protein D3C71_1739500 [compost metagenome]
MPSSCALRNDIPRRSALTSRQSRNSSAQPVTSCRCAPVSLQSWNCTDDSVARRQWLLLRSQCEKRASLSRAELKSH